MENQPSKNHLLLNPKTARILSAIGLLVYLVISLIFSQIRFPNLDEGAYLYKGLQFARGTSTPFEPYGFWTNKMYLPFYLFGWIQLLFKPGLLAPRLLAVVLGTASVAGLWIVTRRIGNEFFAAIAVWAMALNPALNSIYSIANSQVVVIFELVWVMVLILGENRKRWQLIAGAVLSALMVLSRENMIFVIPFLIAYCFWQHGQKNGWIVLGVLILVLVAGHALFWPDILYLWQRQIPSSRRGEGISAMLTSGARIALSSRIHSLGIAVRTFFFPLLILGLTVFSWKKKSSWEKPWQFKATLLLSSTLIVLILTHVYASVLQNYCVYCATSYFAFFVPLCVLLLPLIAPILQEKMRLGVELGNAALLLVSTTLIGYSYFEQAGYSLMNLQVPRLKEGRIISGTVALWQVLANKFDLAYESLRLIIPAGFGLLVGTVLVLLFFGIAFFKNRKQKGNRGSTIGIAILIAGFLLTPLLSWPTQETYCNTNVPRLYQQVGQQLAAVITPGDKVYLDGNIASVPLLPATGIELLPGQVNFTFSYSERQDSDALLKMGLWNEDLGDKWRRQSDVFIIGGEEISQWYDYIESRHLENVTGIDYPAGMPPYTKLYIYTRSQ